MYYVDINFDEAIIEWNRNKRKNGCYYFYTCDFLYKNGKRCGRDLKNKVSNKYCRYHVSKSKNTF